MYDSTCLCQFGSSYYPFAIQPNISHDLTFFATMPKKSRIFFFSENPNEHLVLHIFYSQPLKVRPYIDGIPLAGPDANPSLELDAIPLPSHPHGAHAQNPQEKRFYLKMNGGATGMTEGQSIFLQTIEVVKLSMTAEVSVADFDGDSFVSNLATLLGIDPARIRVADAQVRGGAHSGPQPLKPGIRARPPRPTPNPNITRPMSRRYTVYA